MIHEESVYTSFKRMYIFKMCVLTVGSISFIRTCLESVYVNNRHYKFQNVCLKCIYSLTVVHLSNICNGFG